MKTYKELDVYQRAYRLAIRIHHSSMKLPSELRFDLGDQIRRASRSIPSNIAEGYGRNSTGKDKIHFLNIALGSNNEMLFNLDFMQDANLIDSLEYKELFDEYTICGKQIYKLMKSLEI